MPKRRMTPARIAQIEKWRLAGTLKHVGKAGSSRKAKWPAHKTYWAMKMPDQFTNERAWRRGIINLTDVRTIIELLSDSYTDEGIDIWLRARNRNLNMRRPIDLIVEGQIDTVIDEAKWVAGGM